MKPTHFATATEFRRWLAKHHAGARELLVGLYNKTSGRGGLTYAEALDAALCFGWIDGIRRNVDAARYSIRFTPRRPGSIWSNVNVAHAARLKRAGRMRRAGLAAFAARTAKKTGVYSFENRPEKFPAALAKIFRANKKAWAGWLTQAPGAQRTHVWWVVAAKQDETRRRRLARLIAVCASGRRL